MVIPSAFQLPGLRPIAETANGTFLAVARAGHLVHFFGRTFASIPTMLRHYRRELLRLLSDIAWGNGSIVVGGGTPFLPPVDRDIALDLVGTREFGSRVVLERYRRIR